METNEKIAELRRAVHEAAAREKAADIALNVARAALAEAEGDEKEAEYRRAYVAAQSGEHGGHERFWAICRRSDAERVLAGTSTLDDFVKWERPGIAAEVERMRAQGA